MGGIIRVIRPGGGCTDFFVCVTIRRFSSRAVCCLQEWGVVPDSLKRGSRAGAMKDALKGLMFALDNSRPGSDVSLRT
jgi:hypothetical protein